ncbi:Crp/Fnr family transcriptional regulator [Desulfoscipio gibsoniae]|uniref:cAMP-binding protein n=1 Tax=Desulfoscipio gibsoniae DSM 7213 TaxID=767817 RepID=R4KEH7_9FIRM|nr:Crp/Fnr family transcriptional regulator [Desulfoscipio gibsoniae]AGL00994.1 cAMP-binding protein [Desulfoscipio gibsoniae DSM 7213]
MSKLILTDKEQEKLNSISSIINYPKGQIIFTSGQRTNEVYYIKSGWVRIYRTVSDGRQVAVALRYPGDFIGLAEIFSGTERECCAEAMDNVYIQVVYGNEFKKLLLQNPEFSAKINELLGKRLREAHNAMHDFISNQAQGRLALILKRMSENSGELDGDYIGVNLKVTQVELACMIGTARQTISHLINLFKEDGCIIFDGREIVAVNLKKLQSWIE